jgi:hypothetical protein
MLEQNSIDLMIQHGVEGICSVDYTMSSHLRMSSKLPKATSIEFFSQQVLSIAHLGVNMNLTKRRMSNNIKKIQIIEMLAVKRKVRHHFMKRGDNVSKGGNHQSNSLFSLFTSRF